MMIAAVPTRRAISAVNLLYLKAEISGRWPPRLQEQTSCEGEGTVHYGYGKSGILAKVIPGLA